MTSQVRSKIRLLIAFHRYSAGQRIAEMKWKTIEWNGRWKGNRMETKTLKRMDRIWNTSNSSPKPLVTWCQVQVIRGHQFRTSICDFWIGIIGCMFLGQILSGKVDHRTILNDPNRIGSKSKKNSDSVISFHFCFQNGKVQPFQGIVCSRLYWQVLFRTYIYISI